MKPEYIFLAAVEKKTPAERDAYLAGACGDDVELRGQVAALLKAHDSAGSFLEQPLVEPVPTIDQLSISEKPGTAIGPYKLLEQIGEGGMGTVWMGQQTEPVKRLVALKLIKPGMDSKQVLARFNAERQALALMDHPNIAKVFDAGTTETGRPFFVMELVKGVPLTKYCDEHRLSPKQRLELFIPLCQAIQHAHQKGIIHRDIKPSNVLVAQYDGRPVPKVIDFGVAKAMGQQLTEQTLVTGFGNVIGTLEYMSPEQAEMNQLDIDTRSDIYSLGVVLYELLTGSTPLDKKRLKEAALIELLRVIREEEPPRPSTRLSNSTDSLPSVSAQRQTEPAKLTKLVRGELDWIVMKALEKDRNRRYETASAFAADVGRYLKDEAVQACPPSGWYRFRKFARPNKPRLAVTGLILLFIVVVGVAAAWYQQEQAARGVDLAARQAETERAVTAALAQTETLLEEGDKQIDHPEHWRGTARLAQSAMEKAEELLAAGVATEELASKVQQVRAAVDVALTDSRLLVELDRIRLEQAAVNINDSNFDSGRAAPLYAKLLREYGIDLAAPEAAAVRVRDSRLREAILSALADWRRVSQEEREREQVAKVYEFARQPDSLRSRLIAAVSHRDSEELITLTQDPSLPDLPPTTLVILAMDLAMVKEWAAAERLLRAGLERKPGDFWLNHELGMVLLRQQPARAEEAVRYLTVALALRDDSPGVYLNLGVALEKKDLDGAIRQYQAALRVNPRYAGAHNNLGRALISKEDLEGAIREFRFAIQIDPNSALAHNNLGNALYMKKDLEGAIREYKAALRIDPKHPWAHVSLGNYLREVKGDLDGAIGEYREALQCKRPFPEVYIAHNGLGIALQDKGRWDEAIAEYQEAIRIKPDFANAHYGLGTALYAKGRLDEAIPEYREAIRVKRDFAEAHDNLGIALQDKGRLDEAIAEYREAIRLKKDFAPAHCNLASALRQKGQLDEEIAEYREAIRLKKDYAQAHNNLGNALAAKDQLDEAIAEFREAIRLKKDYAQAHNNLGRALELKGQLDEAIAEYREVLRISKDFGAYKTHSNLGNALRVKGQLDEAIAECREAVRLKNDYAHGHMNLGTALRDKGRMEEAVAAYREAIRLDAQHYRYDAACCAALAGCGQGPGEFTEVERTSLRQQALDWLRAELEVLGECLEKDADKARPVVSHLMQHWLGDPDFAGVRGAEALTKLPGPERQAWQELWSDVEALRAKADGKNSGPEKSAKDK